MNLSLFTSMMRTNLQSILSYSVGMVVYLWLVLWVYPSIASSPALNSLLKTMPSAMLKAVGLQGGIQQIGDYVASEFYGLIYLLILSVYTVMTASKLVARLVDQGSMAYLVGSPVSRLRICVTQAGVMISGLFVISLVTALGGMVGVKWFAKGAALNTGLFLELNAVGFLLYVVMASYSFLISCTVNDEKRAMGISAFITLAFYALNMVGKLSDNLAWLKHWSLFAVFNPQGIMHGTAHMAGLCLVLAVSAFLLFAAGAVVFQRRALPL